MFSKQRTKGTWSIKHNRNGTDLEKFTELLIAYKLEDNFSISKSHEFIMQPEIRRCFGINGFDVKGLYHVIKDLVRTGKL